MAFDRTPLEPEKPWSPPGFRAVVAPPLLDLRELAGDAEGRYATSGDPTRGTRSVDATESATTGARWLKHEDSSDGSDDAPGSPPRRQQEYTDMTTAFFPPESYAHWSLYLTVAWNSVAV